MSIRAEVKGLRELQRELIRIARSLAGPPIVQAVKKATLMVQRDARINATPFVDTGRLRASIVPTVMPAGKVIRGIVGSNVVYAPFQEFGTRRGLKGRFYLTRAFEKNKDRIVKLIDAAIARIVK